MADKYVAVFVRDISGANQIVGKKTFDPSKVKEGIGFKGRTHVIDYTRPIYRVKNKFVYLVDIEKGQRTIRDLDSKAGDIQTSISPKLMDAIFRKEIARQLIAGLASTNNWTLAIVLGVVGALGGLAGGVALAMILGLGA